MLRGLSDIATDARKAPVTIFYSEKMAADCANPYSYDDFIYDRSCHNYE